ncbi:hypothetical protein [Pseudomonas sp. KB-10]|jgi:hypothetical protein|uniref:hypothetical protein n=1 Tax=Pseudomonas sp. KB-10 TaxID=2292264 RepID=UPI001BB03176|nr:hypothetical protein [Pseudomonas sp. KB-10]
MPKLEPKQRSTNERSGIMAAIAANSAWREQESQATKKPPEGGSSAAREHLDQANG